jgi:hypothetical protein
MRPGWHEALAMSASRIPYKRLVTIDQRIELAAAKPVIIPDTVVIDHGKVLLSEVFLRAGDTLGISVQPAHQLTPTDKANIERTFLSINTLFCQHVAGYTGRDVTRRGRGGQDSLWSLSDLQELLDEWVIAGWQCRPHDGLRHPFTPDRPCSPNDAYAALVAAAGYVPVALTGEDYIELMPSQWRTIGDGGIQIDYRTYNSREIRPHARQASGVGGKGTRWEVHFDPYDVSRVWVRNHHARNGEPGWFTVPWTHRSMVAQPFADFTWRHARRIAAERGLDDTNETAVATVLGALLRRASSGPDSSRVLARQKAMAALPPALPAESLPPALLALPAAAGPVNGDAADGEPGESPDEDRDVTGTVVGFGLFDPFGEDRGPRR